MKTRYIKVVFFLLLTGLFSCQDFLEESSQDEVIPSKIEDLDQLLAYEAYPRREKPLYPYLCMLDDDVEQYISSNSGDADITKKLSYIYLWGGRNSTSNQTMFEDFLNLTVNSYPRADIKVDSYETFYKMIAGCNVVIDMIDEVSGETGTKNRVKGEALVLRSFHYFNLINLYAWPYNAPAAPKGNSQGIPLKLSSAIYPNTIVRSSVAQVYASIIEDVEEGIRLLEHSQGSKFRIGVQAAHLLASRYYLFMENWEKVIEHTGAIFDAYDGQLPLFDMTAVQYPETWDGLFPYPINFSNPEILFFYGHKDENALVDININNRCLRASTSLTGSFQAGDQRLNAYLCNTSDAQRKSSKINAEKFEFGYSLRLSEACLNRAEAYARAAAGGKTEYLDKALSDLNLLRQYRILNHVPYAGADFNQDASRVIEECKAERRREFNFEGMRWFDLRRYGMQTFRHPMDESVQAGDEYEIEIPAASPRWVLPIMQIHKESNPGLN